MKYDLNISDNIENEIYTKEKKKVVKGYYSTEKSLVNTIKEKITQGKEYSCSFKTIECQIMDIADDIAYSTFDLEDAFKAGFISPIDMLTQNTVFYDKIIRKIKESIDIEITMDEILNIVSDLMRFMFELPDELLNGISDLKRSRLMGKEESYLFLA